MKSDPREGKEERVLSYGDASHTAEQGDGRFLGALWDEGLASGRADPAETMEDIKAEARRIHGA